MTYTDVWNGTIPNGTEPADTIDDIFRSLKLDISERLDDIFAMPTFVTDPLRPYGLKFTDAQDAVISLGDNAGTPRHLIIKNKAASVTYLDLSSAQLSVAVPTNVIASNGLAVGSLPGRRRIQSSSATLFTLLTDTDGVADLTINTLNAAANIIIGGSNFIAWGPSHSRAYSTVDGNILLLNSTETGFGLLQFGGITSSFPALKRTGADLEIKLADDSTYARSIALSFVSQDTGFFGFNSRSLIKSPANGNILLTNNASTDFGLLQLGGTTASFPALKRSTTLLQVRAADDSGFLLLQAAGIVAPDFSSTSSGVDVTIHNGATLVATFSGTSGLTTLTGGLTTSSTITSGSSLVAAAGSSIVWAGRSVLSSAVNGNILLSNNAISAFGLLQLGGTTSAFAAIKANANQLQIRLADDSGFANIIANAYEVQASGQFFFTGRSGIQSTADGNIVLLNNATTGFTLLQFGGTTSAFPALKKSGSSLAVRRADDSGYAQLLAGVVVYDNGTVPQLWQVGALTHITGIGAAATTIISSASAGILVLQGTDGAGNTFKDVVLFGSAITTQVSATVTGAPAARTYSMVAGSLKLAMASGTYTVDPLFIG